MKLIIHDLTEDTLQKVYPQIAPNDMVITDSGSIRPCIGCFGCWLKTPGACILKTPMNRWEKTLPCAVKC